MIQIYPGFDVILEVSLIGLVIALIGAGGFAFFIFSMENDYDDKIRRNLVEHNPWAILSGRDAAEAPKSKESGKGKVGLILLMIVLAVLIFLLLAIKYGWFGI